MEMNNVYSGCVREKDTESYPLSSVKISNDTFVEQQSAILHNNYEYQVFANREPVLFEDTDGDICLKANACFVNGGDLI